MLKFILLAALVLWLLYSPGVRRLLRSLRSGEETKQPGPGPGPSSAPPRPTAMVPCAHCGVHLPASDAVVNETGQPYCSEAHRRAGPRHA